MYQVALCLGNTTLEIFYWESKADHFSSGRRECWSGVVGFPKKTVPLKRNDVRPVDLSIQLVLLCKDSLQKQ